MDTKLKSNRDTLWLLLLLLLCALIMIGSYGSIWTDVNEIMETEQADGTEVPGWPYYNGNMTDNLESFVRYAYVGSYGMYWELMQTSEQMALQPSEVFFPQSVQTSMEEEMADFDAEFIEWYTSYCSLLEQYGVDYRIVSVQNHQSYTNAAENLENYMEQEEVPFLLKLSFDQDGMASVTEVRNEFGIELGTGAVRGMTKERFLYWMGDTSVSAALCLAPVNAEVYLYSDNAECFLGGEEPPEEVFYYDRYREIRETLQPTYLVLLGILAVFALIFPPFWRIRRTSRIIVRIPAEAAALGCIVVLAAQDNCVTLCERYLSRGRSWQEGLFSFCTYMVLFSVWIVSLMVLYLLPGLGMTRLWNEKMVTGRIIKRVKQYGKRKWLKFVESIQTIDLSDSSDRWLLRIVGVNFVILTVFCLAWFFGILGLVVYSVLLFFFLRKYLKRVKKHYEELRKTAKEMAEGNLHMQSDGDFGIFTPVGEELAKIKEGFAKAVEEELRSRNMKTELITNVSHDLKTPLTAIITYVNLLKDESITEEERRNYVEILDRKSLRLKKLIEDLFEVSKAASGNVQIERRQVDLAEMVRQAVLEQEDRLKEAQIDCRVSVPGERVLGWLDGEKTYRILENLLVNVSKYALAGTRAWVSLEADAEYAVITVKNISAAELDADSSNLTERFVRGDKSRNTEGSGLGLAIVKSFAELQGGIFALVTDGDLFKAVVTLPRQEAESTSIMPST